MAENREGRKDGNGPAKAWASPTLECFCSISNNAAYSNAKTLVMQVLRKINEAGHVVDPVAFAVDVALDKAPQPCRLLRV